MSPYRWQNYVEFLNKLFIIYINDVRFKRVWE